MTLDIAYEVQLIKILSIIHTVSIVCLYLNRPYLQIINPVSVKTDTKSGQSLGGLVSARDRKIILKCF